MRIAIVGPDGAGKTSVANQLKKLLPQVRIVYAGKSHNHQLLTTKLAYRFWQWVKQRRLPILSELARFFIFYPAEFIENLFRFRRANTDQIVIYDRHPIDRMIMVYEYINKHPNVTKLSPQYLLLRCYSWWYKNLFPKIEHIYCLLPEPELCWQRANGHYHNLDEAKWKIEAYRQVATQLNQCQQTVIIVEITSELSINEIAQQILITIESIKKND